VSVFVFLACLFRYIFPYIEGKLLVEKTVGRCIHMVDNLTGNISYSDLKIRAPGSCYGDTYIILLNWQIIEERCANIATSVTIVVI